MTVVVWRREEEKKAMLYYSTAFRRIFFAHFASFPSQTLCRLENEYFCCSMWIYTLVWHTKGGGKEERRGWVKLRVDVRADSQTRENGFFEMGEYKTSCKIVEESPFLAKLFNVVPTRFGENVFVHICAIHVRVCHCVMLI